MVRPSFFLGHQNYIYNEIWVDLSGRPDGWKKSVYDEQIAIITGVNALLILLPSFLTLSLGTSLEIGKRLKSTHKTIKKIEVGFPSSVS